MINVHYIPLHHFFNKKTSIWVKGILAVEICPVPENLFRNRALVLFILHSFILQTTNSFLS